VAIIRDPSDRKVAACYQLRGRDHRRIRCSGPVDGRLRWARCLLPTQRHGWGNCVTRLRTEIDRYKFRGEDLEPSRASSRTVGLGVGPHLGRMTGKLQAAERVSFCRRAIPDGFRQLVITKPGPHSGADSPPDILVRHERRWIRSPFCGPLIPLAKAFL
jgi:hypothetical protein